MIFAPLTKGSNERMPDIVQMVKKGLDRHQVDARTREMIWDCFYWSMGLVCDLAEAHRALGDMLPVLLSSRNYLRAKGEAFLSGTRFSWAFQGTRRLLSASPEGSTSSAA